MASSTLAVWIIYGLVVLYALCYQFQRPIEPFLVEKLVKGGGQDATLALGRVDAFFSIVQGFGSLIMGYILDKFGVKTGLVVTFIACAAQYFILSITDSLNMLFLSKVPGMLMAGFLCAQTAMAKITEAGPDRIEALGRLTSAYTVGGLVGPFLGGVLGSTGNYSLGAQLATAGSLLAIGFVLLLPSGLDSHQSSSAEKEADKKVANKDSEDSPGSWPTRALLILRLVGPLLAAKVISGIANNMARSVQSLTLKNDLGFNEAMMGSMMSGQFAFGGFTNAFLLAPLARMLGGHMDVVVRRCVIAMGLAYVFQAILFSVIQPRSPMTGGIYIGIALFLAVFQYSLGTSITACTQEKVPQDMLGTLMGIEHSMFAISGMIGPLVGTYLFQAFQLSGLFSGCAVLFLLAMLVLRLAAPSKVSPKTKAS